MTPLSADNPTPQTDPTGGCTCPAVWNGVIPPECRIHNPAGRTFTTTGANLDFSPAPAVVREYMGLADWKVVVWRLGIPSDWTLKPRRFDGYWKLTAHGPTALSCGHRSMQVTATALPLAVAEMASRLRLHQRDCR